MNFSITYFIILYISPLIVKLSTKNSTLICVIIFVTNILNRRCTKMVKKYNKLVRDNVLSIIEKENKKYSYRILSDEEYLEKLYAKLNEEHQEFNENNSIEELADMQEVIDAIVKAKGLTNKQFEEIKNTKAEKNGKFEKKIMLIEVIENE